MRWGTRLKFQLFQADFICELFAKIKKLPAITLHLRLICTAVSTIHPPENARNSKKHGQKPCFCWWEEVDSNYRSRRRQIYSLIHLATLESSHRAEYTIYGVFDGFYILNTECIVFRAKFIRELLENFHYFSVCIMVDTVFRASVFNRLSL